LVGVDGAKPASAVVRLSEFLSDDFYFEDRLDIDYGVAVDKAKGNAEGKKFEINRKVGKYSTV